MKGLRQKAAGVEWGGRREEALFGSSFDVVAALPVLGPSGNNFQARLLAQSTEMKPRTESPCPSVAFMISSNLAPPGRFRAV
jgi:hypothetical protein